jgi:hypothetical protein
LPDTCQIDESLVRKAADQIRIGPTERRCSPNHLYSGRKEHERDKLFRRDRLPAVSENELALVLGLAKAWSGMRRAGLSRLCRYEKMRYTDPFLARLKPGANNSNLSHARRRAEVFARPIVGPGERFICNPQDETSTVNLPKAVP